MRDAKDMVTNGAVVGDYLFVVGGTPGIQRIPLEGGERPECIPIEDEVTAIVPWGEKTNSWQVPNCMAFYG